MNEEQAKALKEALAKAGLEDGVRQGLEAAIDKAIQDAASAAKLGDAQAQAAKGDLAATALKEVRARLHAAQAILNKHNIKVDLPNIKTEGLTVDDDGNVTGEYAYEPSNKPPDPPPRGQESDTPLTLSDVKSMKPEEINARWEEVQHVMKQGYSA